MEYDPTNFDLIEEYKKKKHEDEYSRIKNNTQSRLSELDPTIDFSQMKFIITLRNSTSYYEYNGYIYGFCGGEEWFLESTNAEEWIKEIKSHQKEITQEEIEGMKKLHEQMLNDSYSRLSGNEIPQSEPNLYTLKPKGRPSIWLRIKRCFIPKKYKTYGMYPEHVLVLQKDT